MGDMPQHRRCTAVLQKCGEADALTLLLNMFHIDYATFAVILVPICSIQFFFLPKESARMAAGVVLFALRISHLWKCWCWRAL